MLLCPHALRSRSTFMNNFQPTHRKVMGMKACPISPRHGPLEIKILFTNKQADVRQRNEMQKLEKCSCHYAVAASAAAATPITDDNKMTKPK